MSNVYISEPPTSGKVLLKTTVGDIDVELWSKETPKTCRNFIQLCMEGYYDNTIFHRVVRNFIVQGGDPKGDGTGGESVYGEPFKDEFHQRLRFVRRGLIAMANGGKDDNGSQFFFTLAATLELQNKHTIFGKVTGETLFNMLKLSEGLVKDERPEYPHKILKTEILNNPFPDIVPRVKEVAVIEKKFKKRRPGVKNFKLLSFGQEAEEDEQETVNEIKKFAGKSKSTHDVLDDPKLSSETTVPKVKKRKDGDISTDDSDESEEEEEEKEVDPIQQLENIRKKLKTNHKRESYSKKFANDDEPIDMQSIYDEEKMEEKKKKREEIQKEIESVKREYQKNKLQKDKKAEEDKEEEEKKSKTMQEYAEECSRYKEVGKTYPKKGAGREQFTLNLLNKFKQKLENIKEKQREEEERAEAERQAEEETGDDEESWMTHKLKFEDGEPILAKDANTKADDWFDIYDPRNPLNKRRRGESAHVEKKNAKLN